MIEEIVREKTGLDFEILGRKNVENAISTHMRKMGFDNPKEHLDLISGSEEHFAEMIQPLLIPETWFFRYNESFTFLVAHAEKFMAEHKRAIRILSIPCSTGEEPYSIAMALLASEIPEKLIAIDAVDLSRPSLKKAARAVYGMNSFRGGIPEPMNRYFLINNQNYEVVQQVKDIVRFQNFSIFDHGFPLHRDPYDLIFCRNMLIYFSTEAQTEAVKILSRLLSKTGILFIGHAESGVLARKEFESVNFPSSFAFRKNDTAPGDKPVKTHKTPVMENKGRHAPSPAPVKSENTSKKTETRTNSVSLKTPNDKGMMLERAAAFADNGRLQEAEALCIECISSDKLNPSAYYILGVVCLSQGRMQEAEKALTKAVYLNPHYYDALIQLALLKERTGKNEEASRIRLRAEKITDAPALSSISSTMNLTIGSGGNGQ